MSTHRTAARHGIEWQSIPLPVDGALVIVRRPHTDRRGAFDRLLDPALLAELTGQPFSVAQLARSANPAADTLRGLHYQLAPRQESKLVWCSSGSALDIVLDLRADSPTHGRVATVPLTAADTISVFVPAGCAHGYLTTQRETVLQYATDAPYDPDLARGVSWQSADVRQLWPLPAGVVPTLSARDAELPVFAAGELPRLRRSE